MKKCVPVSQQRKACCKPALLAPPRQAGSSARPLKKLLKLIKNPYFVCSPKNYTVQNKNGTYYTRFHHIMRQIQKIAPSPFSRHLSSHSSRPASFLLHRGACIGTGLDSKESNRATLHVRLHWKFSTAHTT